MKAIALFARRFQTLLKSFSKKYDIIRDDIDAQIDFDFEKFFQKLQKKKVSLQIKNKKIIMLIKNNYRKSDHNHDRDRQLIVYRIF